eukprot:1153171-Pelagomonas_calceolata.AAC.3
MQLSNTLQSIHNKRCSTSLHARLPGLQGGLLRPPWWQSEGGPSHWAWMQGPTFGNLVTSISLYTIKRLHLAARTTAWATGWVVEASTVAARWRTCSLGMDAGSNAKTLVTWGLPSVRVPVLSNTTVST